MPSLRAAPALLQLALGLTLVLAACAEAPMARKPGRATGAAEDGGGGDGGAGDTGEPSGDTGTTDGGGADGGGTDGGSGGGTDGGTGGGTDGGGTDGGTGGGTDGGTDSGGADGGTDGGGEEPCPAGLVCVSSFPTTDVNSTTGAASDTFDSYDCAATTDESGPEVIYQVDLDEDGFLALDLPSVESGADVDVHLLRSLDSEDCARRGHWRTGAWLEAGRYYVVVDSWVNGSGVEKDGDYTVTFGFTSGASLAAEGMDAGVAETALQAFDIAWDNGDTDRFEYAITDFSLHSSEPREWIVDLTDGSLLWNLYVGHGEGSSTGSDTGWADTFSNVDGSHMSSLGMMVAGETYEGTYGYSMRLDGLEDGYNDEVRSRAIVVHPWSGSRAEYVSYYGETAETWGCPALDDRESEDVIDTLSDGALLFFWYPDGDWSRSSAYLP